MKEPRVCVVGTGFIGLTLGATLADAGARVLGVDTDPAVVSALNLGRPHFREPGLDEMVARLAGDRLAFAPEIPGERFDYFVICVSTPVDGDRRPVLANVERAVAGIAPHLSRGCAVILRSTVPVGASRRLARALEEQSGLPVGGEGFLFGFVPERIVEGNALYEQRHVPQLVGALDEASADRIEALVTLYNGKVLRLPDPEHAEMCKLLDNAHRDARFAWANEVALACEALGLDFERVRKGCNWAYPRNRIPMASPGVGGACLSKDPHILAWSCDAAGFYPSLVLDARHVNEEMPRLLGAKIVDRLRAAGKTVRGAKAFVMGFAFKGCPETSDARGSSSWPLAEALAEAGARVFGHDPLVPGEVLRGRGVEPCTVEGGFAGADVVVVMTAHQAYREMDVAALAGTARSPLLLVDCWRLHEPPEGVLYSSVGLY